jgi:hypothetical protein
LGALEVGVAGEDCGGATRGLALLVPGVGRGVEFSLGEVEEGVLGALEFGEAGIEFVPGPESKVGGDLIVATAAGVEFFAEVANAADEFGFDKGVDVLGGGGGDGVRG